MRQTLSQHNSSTLLAEHREGALHSAFKLWTFVVSHTKKSGNNCNVPLKLTLHVTFWWCSDSMSSGQTERVLVSRLEWECRLSMADQNNQHRQQPRSVMSHMYRTGVLGSPTTTCSMYIRAANLLCTWEMTQEVKGTRHSTITYTYRIPSIHKTQFLMFEEVLMPFTYLDFHILFFFIY